MNIGVRKMWRFREKEYIYQMHVKLHFKNIYIYVSYGIFKTDNLK